MLLQPLQKTERNIEAYNSIVDNTTLIKGRRLVYLITSPTDYGKEYSPCGICQECYKNSTLFAQFLLSSLTYASLSYFVCLHCANVHTPFMFLLCLTTSRTSKQGIQSYLVLGKTSRTTTLLVLVILIFRTRLCTLFP